MKIQFFPTLRNYRKEYLAKDIFSGVIIAAVSIPISMGYAQNSGLPAAYGLYGSLLPIILFALFSTSRQFIFGVDAAPAAIVGRDPAVCHRVYRLSSGPCADCDRDISSAECCGSSSGCPALSGEQTGILYFHGCLCGCAFSRNDLWRPGRNPALLCRRDHKSHESAQTFPGNDTWKTGIL